jgi:hypothetical protein
MTPLSTEDLTKQLKEEHLSYITDQTPGFFRQKNGKNFAYSLVNWIQIAFKCLFIKNPLKDLDYLIVEMGTDELKAPKNMEYLLTIVKPDIAIWLNVYAAHTGLFAEGLSDKEKNLPLDQRERVIIQKIAAEDGKIITKSGCNVGIYCGDNVPI